MEVMHKTVWNWRERIAEEKNRDEKKYLTEGLERYIEALLAEEATYSFALVMKAVLCETKEFNEFFEKCGKNPLFFHRHRKKDKPVPPGHMVKCMRRWRGISDETDLSDAIEQNEYVKRAVEASILDMCVREGVSEPLACLMCMYELDGYKFTRKSLEKHGISSEHCSVLLGEEDGRVVKSEIGPAIKWVELRHGKKIADVIREKWEENSAKREPRDARNEYFTSLIAEKNHERSTGENPHTWGGKRHSGDGSGQCGAGGLKIPVPADAPPGSDEKIAALKERASAGLPLFHEDDRQSVL